MTHDAVTLVGELERTRDETMRYFALGPTELERAYGPGKWTVRYVLHHLADSETVLNERIRRVLSEPTPFLAVFDEAAWSKALDYSQLPLALSRDVFASVRAS